MANDASGQGVVAPKFRGLLDPGRGIEKKVFGKPLISGKGRDPASLFGDPALREAAAISKQSQADIDKQRKKEAARLATSEAAIADRRERARRGRSLLIATSPQGVRAETLGGA